MRLSRSSRTCRATPVGRSSRSASSTRRRPDASRGSERRRRPRRRGMSATVYFDEVLAEHGLGSLRRASTVTLQVNVGKRCNQVCHHCPVDPGPKRRGVMNDATAARVIELLARNPQLTVLDLTGGAPELAGCFRELVAAGRRLGRRVIDRHNLTVLFEDGQEDLALFLAGQRVEVGGRLPAYRPEKLRA